MLPLKGAPALNTLLITLMLGTALRESIRVFYPERRQPQAVSGAVADGQVSFGDFTLRLDSADPARSPASP